MSLSQKVSVLKKKTERYWQRLGDPANDRITVWQEYVTSLLPMEMEGKSPSTSCETLVLLVGHSIEPLLQSVWAHQPKNVLLILSQQYGDDLSGGDFAWILRQRLLSQLPEDRCVPDEHIDQEIVQADPQAVFRVLIDRVRNRTGVVIDITGAKKSMVAGAFLYAAYANVPISYVDFDDKAYSPHYNRPYGYASYINTFDNPYTAFALRDWERVQQLYDTYHFREALKLLEGDILPLMRQRFFEPQHTSAVERLISVLHCYERWDRGDFYPAAQSAAEIREQGIDFRPPTAVEVLKDIWPYASVEISPQTAAQELLAEHRHLIWDGSSPETSIFCQPSQLLVYVEDELARVQRLIEHNEDYRSALLRAASLNEVLLKARFANLWIRGELVPGSGPLPSFDTLVGKATAGSMIKVLDGRWDELRFGTRRDQQTAALRSGIHLNPFWESCGLDLDTLIDLRNDTIHTYLSVPPSVAQAAADVARHNLDDFRSYWIHDSTPEVTMNMTWRMLCELCGADAFLPPNLLE